MNGQRLLGGGKALVRGTAGIGGFLLALAFGRWAGLSFLLPVGAAAAAYYLLKRAMPAEQGTATKLTAVQVGHLAWFLLAAFVPGGLAQVGLDIVILGGLLTWFGFTQSRKAAYALLAVQVLSAAVNLGAVQSAMEADKLAPLFVHLIFRAAAIYLIALFLMQGRRKALPTQYEDVEPLQEGAPTASAD
jgi:hypothetical protein